MTTATSILEAAAGHMQARADTYDKPDGARSMGAAVEAFNAITGRDLRESEGWLLLAVLKQVRLFQRPGYHADSCEDAAAYLALLGEARAREAVEYEAPSVGEDDDDWPMPGPVRVVLLEDGEEPKSDADADGWIKWESGECPVPEGTRVDIRKRNCEVELDLPAYQFDVPLHVTRAATNWGSIISGSPYNIAAYRRSKEASHG